MNTQLSATSIQLLQTAERLFAQEGIDAVSTRRIAQEANQRNVSALQYHFGSKDNLIDALLAMRLETINQRRQDLLEQLQQRPQGADLHALLEALVLPLVEQLDVSDSHFIGCLYQLYLRARGERVYSTLAPELTAALETVTAAIERCLIELPLKVRIARLRLMGSQLIHSAGDWYYQRERGEDLAPIAELAATLIDFMAGGLAAPVSTSPNSKKRTPRGTQK
ncbi:MAG TPA: helix-turn-helix domain-containing protein [Spongiibacteraceae bacterium]|nr:helix-turn-helix domain-containing protein [Spongiibacteraceae bacterium]